MNIRISVISANVLTYCLNKLFYIEQMQSLNEVPIIVIRRRIDRKK